VTAVTQDLTHLRGGLATLPRVNLLPPEIAEGRKFRQIQMGLGATVVLAVGVVGLLFVSASHSVSTAQGRLDTSKQTGVKLSGDVAKYNDVTAIKGRAIAAQAMLGQAMGDEVLFSQLLNDMSLSVPDNVWITSMTYSAAPGTTPPVGSTAVLIGNLAVSGVAFSHDDVAVWLESLAGQKNYANPYFSNSTEAKIGSRKVVNFSSTAGVTDKALSHRYDKGGI
jgi:Tfp pilus assembly protein PilN